MCKNLYKEKVWTSKKETMDYFIEDIFVDGKHFLLVQLSVFFNYITFFVDLWENVFFLWWRVYFLCYLICKLSQTSYCHFIRKTCSGNIFCVLKFHDNSKLFCWFIRKKPKDFLCIGTLFFLFFKGDMSDLFISYLSAIY